jgi:hypothetical protein
VRVAAPGVSAWAAGARAPDRRYARGVSREASKQGRENRRRGLRGRAALVLAVATIGAGATTGSASAAESVEGGNSFNELSQKAQQETTPTETTATETTGTAAEVHNSNKTIFIGIGAAIVLLIAIAFVIVRDARRVAPAGAEEFGEGKSGRNMAVQRRNRRKKARAAKAARKKHR